MKVIKQEEFYAPTYLNHSLTSKGKKTGNLKATIFTRSFRLIEDIKGRKYIKTQRGFRFVNWDKDTKKAEAEAILEAIGSMKEMKEIEENPPLDFIPNKIKRWKVLTPLTNKR